MSHSRVVLAFLLSAAPPLAAQDWPQWRGPARDGLVAGLGAPRASWPQALQKGWSVAVGEGHASPLVAGDRVYVFARQGDQEILSALEAATGKIAWRQAGPAPYTVNPAAAGHGKGPKATPTLAQGRIFTLGISGILSGVDAATGKLLWRLPLNDRFPETSPAFGAANSPVVDAERVIVFVGGAKGGALAAFDAKTGKALWSWKDDGPAYASPIVAEIAGVRQVVTQSQSFVVGVAAETGALLWKIPLTTAYEQNSVTPIVRGDVVFYSGLDKGLHAARIVKKDAGFASERVWDNDEVAGYMSTPILVGDVLYGHSHKKKGQFFAVDARTGKTLWLSEGRQGDNAALVSAQGALLMLTTESTLLVAKPDPAAFSVVRSYTVADTPTWAHPAPSGNRLFIKDKETLTLWKIE